MPKINLNLTIEAGFLTENLVNWVYLKKILSQRMESLFPPISDFGHFRQISGAIVQFRTLRSVFGQLHAILNTPVRFWTSSLDLARSDVGRSCAISNDSGGFQLLDTNVFFPILVTKAGRKKQRLIWQRKSPSWRHVFSNHMQRIRCNVYNFVLLLRSFA